MAIVFTDKEGNKIGTPSYFVATKKQVEDSLAKYMGTVGGLTVDMFAPDDRTSGNVINTTLDRVFDSSDKGDLWYTSGLQYNNSGSEDTSASYFQCTDWIPVDGDSLYKLRNSGTSGYYQHLMFFDSEKKAINGVGTSNKKLQLVPYQGFVVSPTDAKYLRIFMNSLKSKVIVVDKVVDTPTPVLSADKVSDIPLSKVFKLIKMNQLEDPTYSYMERYNTDYVESEADEVVKESGITEYWRIAEYIPVDANTAYTCSERVTCARFYNAEKEYTIGTNVSNATFTTPAGCAYVRISGTTGARSGDIPASVKVGMFVRKSEFDQYVGISDASEFYLVDTELMIHLRNAKIEGLDGLDTLVETYVQNFKDTVGANTFGGGYTEIIPSEDKATEFTDLLKDVKDCETFLFFTDPHTFRIPDGDDKEGYREKTVRYITPLIQMFNRTPIDTIISGGDWQKGSDSGNGTASWLGSQFGWLDGWMHQYFRDDYISLVGNHDTGIQAGAAQMINSRTMHNIMCRHGVNDGCYFKHTARRTTFYCLDTREGGKDNTTDTPVTDYYWEQIAWLASQLKSDDPDHAIIAQHIYSNQSISSYQSNGVNGSKDLFAVALSDLIGAYNKRTTVTLNGYDYDFTTCVGTVHCIIAGHTHFDYNITDSYGLPIIGTTWLRGQDRTGFDDPIYDLVCVDYDNGLYKTVRVGGTLSNRNIQLYMHS